MSEVDVQGSVGVSEQIIYLNHKISIEHMFYKLN